MTTEAKRGINRAKLFLDAHCYISLAAAVIVVIHVLPRLDEVRWSTTWVGVFMLLTVVISGFFGKYVAKTPVLRRNWRYFHLPYTIAFYLVVLPHMINQTF